MGQYSIGIDLGGTKILTAIVNKETGEVLSSVKKKTKKNKSKEKIINKIIKSIYELLEITKINLDNIDEIGIGVAGQVDRENGIIINTPNLDFSQVNIKEILEKEFNKKLYIGNDVEIATLGEQFFGAGKNEKDFICVFVGTGIGASIVQNGEIRLGATGTAGEIGHIVVDVGGRPCNCGSCGCLEAYASRLAIEKRILGKLKRGIHSDIENYLIEDKPIKTSMIRKSLENNDKLVLETINEAAEYLSSGLASIINFYNPQKIIIGGGLINGVDYYYKKTIELVKNKTLPTPSKEIKFEKAKLGDFSGVVGATLISNQIREKNKL